jgi:hypothetical protein
MVRRSVLLIAAVGIVVSVGLAAWSLRTPRVAAVTLQTAALVRRLQFWACVALAIAPHPERADANRC